MSHFWHERPDRRLFGEREVALLRLLYPALLAVVAAHVRWGEQRQDLIGTLEHLGHPALLCNEAGAVLHVTPSMEALLQADGEAEILRMELQAIVREVRRSAGGQCIRDGQAPGALVREVRTGRAAYRLSGYFYGRDSGRRGGYVVAGIERLTSLRRSEQELSEAFSLTPAEVRVAQLLGDGRSNAEVARELFISPHTARRHTERVLQKMGLGSRAEVPTMLHV